MIEAIVFLVGAAGFFLLGSKSAEISKSAKTGAVSGGFAGAVSASLAGQKAAADLVKNTHIDTLARTMWGEARGQGARGMQAVANVVMNRLKAAQGSAAKARQFGATVSEICKKPWQFSAWNANDPNLEKLLAVTTANADFRVALDLARQAVEGRLPDITGGADHYHANYVKPSWSVGATPVAVVGVHEFYKLA